MIDEVALGLRTGDTESQMNTQHRTRAVRGRVAAVSAWACVCEAGVVYLVCPVGIQIGRYLIAVLDTRYGRKMPTDRAGTGRP